MTVEKDKFVEEKHKSFWGIVKDRLLPKGVFWSKDDDAVLFIFYRGALKFFAFFEWYLKNMLDGIFLKNDNALDKFAKEYDQPASIGVEGFREIVNGEFFFTLDYLKKLVDDSTEGVSVTEYHRRMNCTDPCNSALGLEGGEFVFYVRVNGAAENLKKAIERVRPAFISIFYQSV